ncbi:MAG: hypothetical protein ABJE95_04920 [Byssovorax sp.]
MMTLLEVTLTARSPHADIDLESITGRSAGFRIGVGADPGRAAGRAYDWICRDIRMVRVERQRARRGRKRGWLQRRRHHFEREPEHRRLVVVADGEGQMRRGITGSGRGCNAG